MYFQQILPVESDGLVNKKSSNNLFTNDSLFTPKSILKKTKLEKKIPKLYSNKNNNNFNTRNSSSTSSENEEPSEGIIKFNDKMSDENVKHDSIENTKKPVERRLKHRSKSIRTSDSNRVQNIKRSKSFDENCVIISRNSILEDENGDHLKNIIQRHVKTLNKLINHITVLKHSNSQGVTKNEESQENSDSKKQSSNDSDFDPANVILSSLLSSNTTEVGNGVEIHIEKEEQIEPQKKEKEEQINPQKVESLEKNEEDTLKKRLDRVEKMIEELANINKREESLFETKKDKKMKKKSCGIS